MARRKNSPAPPPARPHPEVLVLRKAITTLFRSGGFDLRIGSGDPFRIEVVPGARFRSALSSTSDRYADVARAAVAGAVVRTVGKAGPRSFRLMGGDPSDLADAKKRDQALARYKEVLRSLMHRAVDYGGLAGLSGLPDNRLLVWGTGTANSFAIFRLGAPEPDMDEVDRLMRLAEAEIEDDNGGYGDGEEFATPRWTAGLSRTSDQLVPAKSPTAPSTEVEPPTLALDTPSLDIQAEAPDVLGLRSHSPTPERLHKAVNAVVTGRGLPWDARVVSTNPLKLRLRPGRRFVWHLQGKRLDTDIARSWTAVARVVQCLVVASNTKGLLRAIPGCPPPRQGESGPEFVERYREALKGRIDRAIDRGGYEALNALAIWAGDDPKFGN